MVSDDKVYLIDRVSTGLTVASSCDYPCWECPVGQPSKCLSCNTNEGSKFPLFFDGTCRPPNDCPDGYFEMNGICSQCDPGCLLCEETSQTCLECHFGMYLLGNECMNVCPDTHVGMDDSKTCVACTKPCMTCEGSLDYCTSCDQTLPEIFFFRNKCYETCPLDISVEDEGVCVECNPNCKTCDSDYSADFCTSCYGDDYLDYFTNTCVKTCPADVTVVNNNAVTPKG